MNVNDGGVSDAVEVELVSKLEVRAVTPVLVDVTESPQRLYHRPQHWAEYLY